MNSFLLFINSNILLILLFVFMFNVNIEAIITNLSQQQLSKLEKCSNETYVCVKDSMDEQEIYCCCNQKWSNCRQTLSCEDASSLSSLSSSSSTSPSRHQDDCRFLSTYERYFKRPKNKNCTSLPDLQCNGSQQLMMGNGNLMQSLLFTMIITIIIGYHHHHYY
ncbi:uncharacterized protein LOC124495519 [Dermatophagoides farinae]|uniref:Transmembrane protein n=1 Tax=Dermatophagoides farinae TaxID=6954 RepID=A0A922I4N5_DERFA|nr:uncharacterized protein LOC124495519 [Dermatophagoides farinae]KAH9521240.1 hypothetical protein DERF_004914 [Dermatophagoides farinae]